MYLSKLILDPRSRRVQREVAVPYEMHRSLMRAFPDDLPQGEERVLFRLDTESPGGLVLLVQSWDLPDWSWLAEPRVRGYLLPVGQPNPAVKSFDLKLAPGQMLSFRLRANPTAKRTFEGQTRDKKRVGLYREEEQLDWLRRKGEQGGFCLLAARTNKQQDVGGSIHRDEAKHDLKLAAVQFDGLLRVVDADRLAQAVQRGVGSGKAFGFGLLSLARA